MNCLFAVKADAEGADRSRQCADNAPTAGPDLSEGLVNASMRVPVNGLSTSSKRIRLQVGS